MSPHNKYDFYQPNKKISSIDIKDVLSDYIINKNINSDFKAALNQRSESSPAPLVIL